MDISRDQSDYLEDDSFVSDGNDDMGMDDNSLDYDMNGIAWREIEKYRERKELESLLKDDLYNGMDIYSIWE